MLSVSFRQGAVSMIQLFRSGALWKISMLQKIPATGAGILQTLTVKVKLKR
jgi:hypothetical protein